MLLVAILLGCSEVFDFSSVNSDFSADIGSGNASELLGGEGVLLFLPGFTEVTSGAI